MEHDYVSLIMTHISNSKETQLLSEIRLAQRIKEGQDLTAVDFAVERISIVEGEILCVININQSKC
jgi:hypothetical protein